MGVAVMSDFREVQFGELTNAADMISGLGGFLLVVSKPDGNVNTMTCGWGGLGQFWRKNGCVIMVRDSRYSYEFTESANTMSLCFLDGGEDARRHLSYLGTVSGRDEDKIAKSGLTLCFDNNIPYFAESKSVFFMKKTYSQMMDPACFDQKDVDISCYPKKDYHKFYFCEILKCLQKADPILNGKL